ncbi:two-component hybrid sensor and regulator [sediment metagenome]|uniref:Two-component hybrid sensor and regulator n=1 Tax=sediment metagenome TaxID=749907 RepID=D9PIL2_9ZZZZ
MNLGADDYLTKPYKQSDLINAISSKLSKAQRQEKLTEKKIEELCRSIAGSLPHEFRTPLNSIIGFIQLLKSEYELFSKEDIFNILKNVYESSLELNQTLNNFMYYLKMMELRHTGPQDYSGYVVSSDALIKEIAYRIAGKYKRSNDLDMSLVDSVVKISEEHFHKAIMELADNAFKFSKKGSPVSIKSELSGQHSLNVIITNYGRGMSDEEIKNIGAFRQFNRDLYEQQGSGLGLTIVKIISEIYKGSLAFDSMKERYTKVVISFPV